MPLGIEQLVRGVPAKAVRGLFHGKNIQSGYQCVDKGKRPRTRREWQPNVQYKFLYSEVLGRRVRLFVTTHALKRIDQAGGLDMYVLTEPAAAKASIVAEELRHVIKQAYKEKGLKLPRKEGPTSILSIVTQKLRDAGLHASQAAVKPAPQAASQPADPASDSAGQPAAPETAQPQSPAPPPSPRRPAAPKIRNALDAYANAAQSRVRAHDAVRPSAALTSGKHATQQVREALLREKRAHAARLRRRAAQLATLQGTARNLALRAAASSIRFRGLQQVDSALVTLDELAAHAASDGERARWAHLADRYRPSVPGVVVGNTFVPATFSSDRTFVSPRGGAGAAAGASGGQVMVRMPSPVYASGRKLARLRKWLDEQWLRERIVPETDASKLVLPNGMVLWSERRRHSGLPFAVWQRTPRGAPDAAATP